MLEFHPNSGNIRREHGQKIGQSRNSSPSSSSASSGILFAPTCHQHDDPPSPPSPPLWSSTSDPLLPTTARAQAIARGRWELMEMLKDVPESAYELSLKDLVERVAVKEKQEPREEEGQNRGLTKKKKRKKGNGGRWEQNYGNGGLLLKMFVPSSYLASKPAAGSGRVSPRPLFVVEGKECEGGSGGDNWEWWRKGFMVVGFGRNSRSSSSGSSNSNRSDGSSTSSSRHSDGLLTGCWSFLRPSRRKSNRD